jgi:hypothetical protein
MQPPGMATVGDGEEGTVTTTTTTRQMRRARYPGTGMGMRDEDNNEEMGSVGRGTAMVAQDEEHEKTPQEMLLMSLGPQVSFFRSLFHFFVTN